MAQQLFEKSAYRSLVEKYFFHDHVRRAASGAGPQKATEGFFTG